MKFRVSVIEAISVLKTLKKYFRIFIKIPKFLQ